MKTKLATVILFTSAVLSVSGDPPSSWSNLVVNGGFELPALPSGANHVVPANEMAPWQTTEIGFGISVGMAAEGRQHVEVVEIWQTVPTVPGEDYRFTFYHSPRPGVDSPLIVEINGQVIRTFAENGTALTEVKWRLYGTNFTATSDSMTIRFNGHGVAGSTHIDDVRLERLPLSSTLRVSEVEFCWPSVVSRVYQVQYRSILTANLWTDLLQPVQGNGDERCIKDPVPADEPKRFYRVIY